MPDRRQYRFEGVEPEIHPDADVSRESTLVGDVTVGADASVWPGVVLRGDIGPVSIGQQSHVGDNAVVHASTIGDRVMVGHGAVINEATVEDGSLVGFNSTVNTGVTVGAGSVVAAGAVIPEQYDIPAESFIRGVPARVTPLSDERLSAEEIFSKYSSGEYGDLVDRHEELFDE
ncbi:gamma carbonic anhydrase family protein [Haloprofundus marisrubri]|uniref:Gamma carbonic anhydrase family protein n=1 Tax=Haloprofundus marisrubri TaxID=1514971 RepID=A0A0W1R3D8_9EURY|nr:gamma carbonic anhydrase family protein [Haloprofundus marisrubri]KTG07644.1 gamma carbonic anhydrase family protein [Haloprofundus marisrubri]